MRHFKMEKLKKSLRKHKKSANRCLAECKFLTVLDIEDLCKTNDWFSCGDDEQYNKLIFLINADKITHRDYENLTILSYIIWLCSCNTSAEEIKETITNYLIEKLHD